MILVTGGAGFIGSNFVLDWLADDATRGEAIVSLDALTYTGSLRNLTSLHGAPRHIFAHCDLCDQALVDRLLVEQRPRANVHFAAESHVDRVIHGLGELMRTNLRGTFTGRQIRDWLYVTDHCSGIRAMLARGRVGETDNIGGWNEQANIDIVKAICALLDELRPDPAGPYARLTTHVAHRRYAIDARKIERELNGVRCGS
jgi:dTDP-D-glucose 4,6-dehydratase